LKLAYKKNLHFSKLASKGSYIIGVDWEIRKLNSHLFLIIQNPLPIKQKYRYKTDILPWKGDFGCPVVTSFSSRELSDPEGKGVIEDIIF